MSLVRPRINVSFDRDGHSNWASLVDALARALGPKANRLAGATSFTEIRINDGTVALQDATRGINETFNNVELALAWPSYSKRFAATGRVVWHDEPIDNHHYPDGFRIRARGDRSAMKIRLAGRARSNSPSKASGARGRRCRSKARCGRRAIAARNVALRPASNRSPGAEDLAALRSRPRQRVGRTIALLSTVNVELDGNVAEGVSPSPPTAGRPCKARSPQERLI